MKYRINRLMLGLLGLLATSCFLLAGEDEDAKLTAFFKNYLEAQFRQRPLEATRLGDHRFDNRLDEVSPKARRAWTELVRTTLQHLPEQVRYHKLSPSGQINFDILKSHLTRLLWLAENTGSFQLGDNTYCFEKDPRAFNEYINDSIFLLLTQSTLPRATNVRNCIARMADIPHVVAAAKASLHNPPLVFVQTALRQNRGAIDFYEHEIYDLAGETSQQSELRTAAKPVIACLKDYQQYLQKELLRQAKGDWRLGKEKFTRKLDLELDAGLSADEVLHEAEAEAERVERDMYVIARQSVGHVVSR